MSVEAVSWAFKQNLPCAQKFVLVALGDYANWYGESWPSQSTLAEKCGLSRQHVNKVLGDLERDGYITITERTRKNGADTSCCYILSLPEESRPEPAGGRDDELPKHLRVGGFVYVFQDGDRCKIGITRSVEKRHRALCSATGKKLGIVATFACTMQTARRVELQAHQTFHQYRQQGEWFAVSAKEAAVYIAGVVSTETTPPVVTGDTPVSTETTPPVVTGDTIEPSLNLSVDPSKNPQVDLLGTPPPPPRPKKNGNGKDHTRVLPELPEFVPVQAWEDFVAMRRKIGHSLTASSAQKIVNKLDRLRQEGYDPGEVLDESTMNEWRGVFRPKGHFNGHQNGRNQSSTDQHLAGLALLSKELHRRESG